MPDIATPPVAPAAQPKSPLLDLLIGNVVADEKPQVQEAPPVRGRTIMEVLDDPPEEVVPTPEKKEATPAAPATPVTPPVDDKGIKVRKKAAATQIPPAPTPAPVHVPATPPATPVQTVEDDAEFEKNLIDEEKAVLDRAKFAADKFPEHKDLYKKTKDFLKEVNKRAADPNFDESSPEYQEWLEKNSPKLSPLQMERIREAQYEAKFEKRIQSEREERDNELFKRDQEPVVKNKVNQSFVKMVNEAIEPELLALIKQGDAKAAEAKPLEYEITRDIINLAKSDLETFHRLTTRNPRTGVALVQYDGTNEQHARVLQLVNDLCDDFEKNGGDARMRNGKRFASRSVYPAIPAAERSKYWTFTEAELENMAIRNIKPAIQNAISMKRKEFERYIRPPAAPATSTVPPAPANGTPPAPRPSMAPSNGGRQVGDNPALRAFLGTPESAA